MKQNEIEYHVGSVSGKFKLLGFATGAYSCRCSTCEKEFIGDKRASMCLECAIDKAEELRLEKFIELEKRSRKQI